VGEIVPLARFARSRDFVLSCFRARSRFPDVPPLQGSNLSLNPFQGFTPLAISCRPAGAPEKELVVNLEFVILNFSRSAGYGALKMV